ncbi:hypothetical protein GCM10025868_12890 [Angustibacter aerolatus]|uniref:Uncharacterized protein n=1 Tax=Angustibacter aerolatus TaxID=1162965 RepID=A0ABQ6JE02_9ACTN|nr:hypothetical protein GCM10025868_12890 [Angustibacter aerolatus]
MPSSVYILIAKPRGSRAASLESRPPATVENRMASLGALAGLAEHLGSGVLRDRLVADRAVGLEVPEGGGAAGVHDALGDALAVEVADLLEELVVLERRRAASADGALVLVVVHRVTLAVGEHRPVVTRLGALAGHVGHDVSLSIC